MEVAVHVSQAQAEMACGRAESSGRLPITDFWAELMTAYYLSNRQSDALNTFQRLKTGLAVELGPNPAQVTLHERVLRREPLEVKQSAVTASS